MNSHDKPPLSAGHQNEAIYYDTKYGLVSIWHRNHNTDNFSKSNVL